MSTIFKETTRGAAYPLLLAGVVAVALTGNLCAATLRVTVVTVPPKFGSTPEICYVTREAVPRQASTVSVTDASAVFDIEIPPKTPGGVIPVKVTATERGYTGASVDVQLADGVQNVTITLHEGSGGAVCARSLVAAQFAPQLQLSTFKVCHPTSSCNDSIRVVSGRARAKLTYHAESNNNAVVRDYRVASSETALRSASWQRVPAGAPEQPIDFTFDVGNIDRDVEKRTFFQVRAAGVESNVLADSTGIRPDPTGARDYEIRGAELTEFLILAKQMGFTVMTVANNQTGESFEKADPSETGLIYGRKVKTCCAAVRDMQLTFFRGRAFNAGWKVKEIEILPTSDCREGEFAVPRFSAALGPMVSFVTGDLRSVTTRPTATGGLFTVPPACLACEYPLRRIILEGPAIVEDPSKPWKDAVRR